jgi:hypothetical protein
VSRIEGKIEGSGDEPIEVADILAALARETRASPKRRQDAVSCYLSASEGWREASELLGGAFAPDETRFKSGKDE